MIFETICVIFPILYWRLTPTHSTKCPEVKSALYINIYVCNACVSLQFWLNRTAYLGIDSEGQRHFPAISPHAARFLATERRVIGVGLDTASVDVNEPNIPHRVLFAENIYIIENMNNLHLIPQTGAHAVVMMISITGASGAPVRVIAMLPWTLLPFVFQ